ncbi:hypothetical protein [Streptomyces sp. NBC_01207]|uniref:hypothetical protein n=1 Tax=Streptomyces sp. NBC_01207 TaxID=2903772 RepID=UPI002E0E29E2|nr:hypothetical protein OG457_00390 [Streptomyces sp. NBC_01207]
MAEKVQENDQNVWRAGYTTEVNGALFCAQRGARREGSKQLPLRWNSFAPAATKPFIAALEKASKPLAKGATGEQEAQRQKDVRTAAEALEQARK